MVALSAVDAAFVFCLFRFLNQLRWAINQTNATTSVETKSCCKGNKGISHANLLILKLLQKAEV